MLSLNKKGFEITFSNQVVVDLLRWCLLHIRHGPYKESERERGGRELMKYKSKKNKRTMQVVLAVIEAPSETRRVV